MPSEKGNAFVYILIAVVLFAALSFILVRQEDSKEQGTLSPDQAKILATQLITTATQIKSALDQMVMAGTDPSDFDFEKPGSFSGSLHIDKVFHPDGGGVVLPPLPERSLPSTAVTGPASSWYIGRFNNVEWAGSATNDVMLAAYGIERIVCEEINRTLTGDNTIPTLTVTARSVFVDVAEHSGSNNNLTSTNCSTCNEQASLCVENAAQDRYAFYNIMISE